MQKLKDELKQLETRAYSLKTKAARSKAFDAVKAKRREILDVLYANLKTFGTHSVKATVLSFTDGDDHVFVSTPYGNLWASPTSDAVSKSWYGGTCCVQYVKGQELVIEIETDVNFDRLFIELIPRRIHGGTLNETKYAELCKRTDLAFFKYPSGNMSGLFSTK